MNIVRYLILLICLLRVFSLVFYDIEDKDMILNMDFDEYFIDLVNIFIKNINNYFYLC